jgi:nicotinamide mononucleotide transporter
LALRDTQVTAALTLAASIVAIAMAWLGLASWLEAASFITGAVCVWLTVKENIWNFPLGLANVATFCVVFYQARLFADAGLQVVYFVLGLVGWWMWLHGGEHRTELRVSRSTPRELAILAVCTVAATLLLWQALAALGGSARFWDALTTSISLASQWLLNRKRVESWWGWILVDAIYVPLYVAKELYLTALLYAVFLVMAVMGLRAWRRALPAEPNGPAVDVGPLVGGAVP